LRNIKRDLMNIGKNIFNNWHCGMNEALENLIGEGVGVKMEKNGGGIYGLL
jgi:hypothetical protein